MSMWDNRSMPIGIRQSVDTIFASIMTGGIDTSKPKNLELLSSKIQVKKYAVPKFETRFEYNIFNNTYAAFYSIIKASGITDFTMDQIETIVDNNRKEILDSPFIRKQDFIGGDRNIPNDDDIINAMISVLKNEYARLSMRNVTESEFDSACIIYIDWYKEAYMTYVCNNMTIIMSNTGLDIKLGTSRNKHYQGMKDAQDYYTRCMAELESLDETGDRSSKLVFDNEMATRFLDDIETGDGDLTIVNTGIIEIDRAWGSFSRGNLVTVLGPPKGGKTKFCQYMAVRALKKKLNVQVVIAEGTKEEWRAGLIASFIADKSIKKNGKVLRFSASKILKNEYRKMPQHNKIIKAATLEMANSPELGSLCIDEKKIVAENIEGMLKALYKEHPYDVLIIDSIVNAVSSGNKKKNDALSEAYMTTKRTLVQSLPKQVLAICTAQLKQQAIDELRSTTDGEMGVTSAGETAEVIRSSDYILGVYASKAEQKADITNMYSVACRHSETFDTFKCRSYLDCSFFFSEDDTV